MTPTPRTTPPPSATPPAPVMLPPPRLRPRPPSPRPSLLPQTRTITRWRAVTTSSQRAPNQAACRSQGAPYTAWRPPSDPAPPVTTTILPAASSSTQTQQADSWRGGTEAPQSGVWSVTLALASLEEQQTFRGMYGLVWILSLIFGSS